MAPTKEEAVGDDVAGEGGREGEAPPDECLPRVCHVPSAWRRSITPAVGKPSRTHAGSAEIDESPKAQARRARTRDTKEVL